MKYFAPFLLLLLSIPFSSVGQSPAMMVGEEWTITSKVLQEERQLWIQLPEHYKTTKASYPVLYLLDAEWNFHFVSGLVRQLTSSGDIPPMVLVGVVNTNRNRDLTPPGPNASSNGRFGGAKSFLSFLSEEVHPWLENKYRLHPYRILAGHSFGGLFTVFALLQQPDFFQGYIALSPSLGRNNEQQVEVAKTYVQKKELPTQRLFLAVGNEGGYSQLSSEKFIKVLQQAQPEQLSWQYQPWPEENHVSVTIPGFRQGLQYLFQGYNLAHFPALDDYFLVEQHYRELSDRLGYTIEVPEEQFEKYITQLLAARDLDYAFFLLEKYQKTFPASPIMLRCYGDAHLLKGELAKAKGYYQRLLEMDPENVELEQLLQKLK